MTLAVEDRRTEDRSNPVGRALHLVERNIRAYGQQRMVFLSSFIEPILYLFSVGIGVGALVGDVMTPGGQSVPYRSFVAPGLMAVAAMNGAIFDTTFNFFIKLKYAKSYDAILATPMGVHDVAAGEVIWALMRGALQAFAFLAVMAAVGLIESPLAFLALPAALLIGMAFAGAGLAGATWIRSFVDFDYVALAMIPLFLFSGVFFPLDRYPDAIATIIEFTPLYQGVELQRALVLGELRPDLLFNVAYLAVMGVAGMRIAGKRLGRLLQP
ncbi:MAG TPA: ABC transporter permease [Acidimicrobiales bacterium]|nr:ABC transporter permease [Acidimicrobiales bacterium]